MDANFFQSEKGSMAWYKTGEGKPIVILHGWGSDSKVMNPVAEQIKNIRTCYLIDFPGFGQSPEPEEAWSVDDYADITEEFILKTVDEPKVDLLVHSFGARVALKLLTRQEISSKIDKVVFTGAAGLKPKRSASFYLRKYTAKSLKLPFYLLPAKVREKGLGKLRASSLWKSLGSSDYQKLSGVMRETFVDCVNEHLDHLFPKVNHEILLIWGKNDTATPPEQGRRMERNLKNSALVLVEGGGHYSFLDKPRHFGSILKAYLTSS